MYKNNNKKRTHATQEEINGTTFEQILAFVAHTEHSNVSHYQYKYTPLLHYLQKSKVFDWLPSTELPTEIQDV